MDLNAKEKKKNPFLGYSDNNTDTKVHFELEFEPEYLENIKDIETTFHLVKKISLGNMHLYNKKGAIQKYDSIEAILNDYFEIRLELYQKRKDYLLSELDSNLLDLLYDKIL